MRDADLICFCLAVTRGEISAEVRGGNASIAQLKQILGCCTGCGTCEERVKQVIEETQKSSGSSQAA